MSSRGLHAHRSPQPMDTWPPWPGGMRVLPGPIDWHSGPRRAAVSPRNRGRLLHAALAALVAAALGHAPMYVSRSLDSTTPYAPPLDLRRVYFDDRPALVTTTANWRKVPLLVSYDVVRRQPFLWQRMNVEDWDSVPLPLRWEALNSMIAAHAGLLVAPDRWDRMTAADWDPIPQPIRALAFRHMLNYWAGHYRIATRHGLSPRVVGDMLAAIVMAESWFDHRAINVNEWGNRDLGVGQASDRARAAVARLFVRGEVDVTFSDDDYLDPWKGTRFVALWVDRLLDECDSDLETSVRAYHKGSRRALEGDGADYLATVRRRLRRLTQPPQTPDAWSHLLARDRELTRAAWPWTATRPSASEDSDESTLVRTEASVPEGAASGQE